MMTYKGYIGKVEYDDDAHILSGVVVNTRTVITFQATSVMEIEKEFHASVDDYLEWCAEDGVDPEKPYSGQLRVRFSPDLHRKMSIKAQTMGMSLNGFIVKAVEDELMQG